MDLESLDVTTLARLAGEAASALVLKQMKGAGHADVRDAYGYIFQRLIDNEPTIGELAESLQITQ